jgi:HK97 family phage major capsid protein
MSNALISKHIGERDQLVALVRNYSEAAAEEGRDLTSTELETITRSRGRIAELDVQLEAISADLDLADETSRKLRALDPTVIGAPSHYRSAGEVLFDVLHQGEEVSRRRFAGAMKRAAEHMGTDKAKTVPTAGDLGGLIVTPNVGAVIDPFPAGMPFANAVGMIDAPNSLHFMRPRILDPDFEASTGPQGATTTLGFEKAELPSKKFEVTADPIALTTVGGYLNISQQLISLQPGSLDLIISHMNKRLAGAIDRAIVAEVAKSTGKVTLAANADAAAILKALFAASAAVYSSTGELATWVAMGPLGWARLGSLTDAAGRPMFPYLGAANAIGTADASTFAMAGPAGLRPVVTPAIADDSFWVGNGACAEGYIYRFPVLEAVEPSVLGRQVSVSAAIAGHRPIANGAVHLAP